MITTTPPPCAGCTACQNNDPRPIDGDEVPRLVDITHFNGELGHIEPNDDHIIQVYRVRGKDIIETGDITFFQLRQNNEVIFSEVVYATTKELFIFSKYTHLLFVQQHPITEPTKLHAIIQQYSSILPDDFTVMINGNLISYHYHKK